MITEKRIRDFMDALKTLAKKHDFEDKHFLVFCFTEETYQHLTDNLVKQVLMMEEVNGKWID